MKSITVRLPDSLALEIERESQGRGIAKSDVIRERLERAGKNDPANVLAGIADLIGSVDDLPPELSGSRKQYLSETGYGRKRAR